jgi:chitodextrinase
MRVGSFIIWIYLLAASASACSQNSAKKSTGQGSIETFISEEYNDFNIIFHQDFENTSIGIYDYDQWARNWNDPPFGDNYRKRTEIVDYNAGGRVSRGMKWFFPENTYGVNADNGHIWWAPLGEDQIECYLSYSIMFKPGFQSVKGGKIPGLREEHVWSGERPRWTAGYKGSLMFKPGKDGAPQPVFYLYHHDQQLETVGDTEYWNGYTFDVTSEEWYDITYRVVMNTATATDAAGPDGLKDGIVEGYVNGVLWGQVTGLRLRNLAKLGTDQIAVNAFFGGSNEDWATVRDEWMMFDNFYVWTYSGDYLKNHPSVSRGRQANSLKEEIYTPFDVLFGNSQKVVSESMIPGGLHVIDTAENAVTIRWNAVADQPGMAGYKIYLNDILFGATGDTTYTLEQLLPNTSYTIAISSNYQDSDESPKSPAITVITRSIDTSAPTAPSNLIAQQITSYSFQLSWYPSLDDYEIERYMIFIDGNPTFSTYQNYIEVSRLQPNTTYDIAVKAFDTSNNPSPLSNALAVTTADPDTQPPTAPTGLTATRISEESIGLQWNPSADNVGVRDYKIYLNDVEWHSSTRTEATVAQLQPGLTYKITVSAVDEGTNESPKSASIEVTTVNSDVTASPALPDISIVQVLKNTSTPSSISEMSSLGYAEIESYGIEIFEKENLINESIILSESIKSQVIHNNRIEKGLLALYDFSEGEGNLIEDISGAHPPLDLVIDNEGTSTKWLKGQGLKIVGNTVISQKETSSRLIESLSSTDEITIEAWIKQEEKKQTGPARIVTLSSDVYEGAAALGHQGNEVHFNYISRLATSESDSNGNPELKTVQNFISTSLHHLVFTRNNEGQEKIYINGLLLASGYRDGDFSSWKNDYKLALANEISGERPWKGTYYLVAMYNEALSSEEVNQNYRSGFGNIRFATSLDTLKTNISYDLVPYIRTNHGIVYGESRDFMYRSVAETDSLLAIYPNPCDGDLTVTIRNDDQNVQQGQLSLTDFSGKIHYSRLVDLSERMFEKVIHLQLPGSLNNGLYMLIFVTGTGSAAEKLILLR